MRISEMKELRVIISGGGTGGHIFPAIAIANAIKDRYPEASILFVGANNRMEMQKVPAAGYEIIGLDVAGLNRKNLLKNFSVLVKLKKSLSKAKKIIRKFDPQIAIGVGGYASGPTLKVANSLGIPTLIQEQNSYAGVTNKLLSKKASAICVAYEDMERFFPKDKIVITGNPCRQDLLSTSIIKDEACKFFKLDPNKKTVLVIGGSLGARTINNSIIKYISEQHDDSIQIIWQCGQIHFFDLKIELEHRINKDIVRLYDFINRMDLAYKAADLVISRAGASSISELSLLRKPVILIPSPNVAEDHQTQNALALVKKDAAILVKDIDAEKELMQVMEDTINNTDKLNLLSENIAKFAQLDSANRIVDEMEKIINKQ